MKAKGVMAKNVLLIQLQTHPLISKLNEATQPINFSRNETGEVQLETKFSKSLISILSGKSIQPGSMVMALYSVVVEIRKPYIHP